jgi:hypothetical protein
MRLDIHSIHLCTDKMKIDIEREDPHKHLPLNKLLLAVFLQLTEQHPSESSFQFRT